MLWLRTERHGLAGDRAPWSAADRAPCSGCGQNAMVCCGQSAKLWLWTDLPCLTCLDKTSADKKWHNNLSVTLKLPPRSGEVRGGQVLC